MNPPIEKPAQAGSEVDGIAPHHLEVRRAPAWETQVDFPAGFSGCENMFYDFANQRVVFVGIDGSSQLAACYADVTADPWSMSSVTTLVASAINPGGVHRQNVQWWGGDLYVIASNGNVYRGSSYTAAIASFYASGDAQCIAPFAGRMYMAATDGTIYRLNDGDTAFESYCTSAGNLKIRGMFAFKGQMLVVSLAPTGHVLLHRLPIEASTPKLATVASIPSSRGDQQLSGLIGTNFRALLWDKLYFSTGRDKLLDGSEGINLFTFNGTTVELVTSYSFTNSALLFYGLLPWHDHVLVYELAANSQVFKLLEGNGWATGIPGLTLVSGPTIFNLFAPGGELVLLTISGSDEGIRYLSHDTLSDGHIITPWLDMQQPGRQKRLESITVLMDGRTNNFKVPIKYRVDDTGSWTTAATGNNTLRPTATGIGEAFYTLQVRIDLDDDTGGNQDHRIQAIDVLFSIDT